MTTKITPKTLLWALRRTSMGTGPIWVLRHEDRVWLGSEYWVILPSAVAGVALDELWDECNLSGAETGRFTVDLAVKERAAGELPDLAKLIPEVDHLGYVRSRPLADGALCHVTEAGVPYEMWRRQDGAWINVHAEQAAFATTYAAPEHWRQDEPSSPVIGINDDGNACALLIPMQVDRARPLFRDPELPPQLFPVAL